MTSKALMGMVVPSLRNPLKRRQSLEMALKTKDSWEVGL